MLLKDEETRTYIINKLNSKGITSVFHYVPLHSSPAGIRFGRISEELKYTDKVSERLVRLPIWTGMDLQTVKLVVEALTNF